jgi:general secretion pathway protein A
MYEEFFGLISSPFQLSPDPFFMIPSEKSQEALASIYGAIQLRKGFVVMTGEVGTGKTLVLRCLMERLEREEIPFAYFIGPRLSTVDFLSYIAFELGLSVPEPSKGNLLRALYVFLLSQFEKGFTTVLIVDEAHQMPRSVLEEIRLLTNFETAQQKLAQIVLVGQPELDKKLDTVELRSLKQRIAVRCHLEPLRAEDIGLYIERRLELAGAGSQAATLFPPESVQAIYSYSQGIPRLVNSICDQALTAACARQIRVVPVEVIKSVASHFRLEPVARIKLPEKPVSLASHSDDPEPDSSRHLISLPSVAAVSAREMEAPVPHHVVEDKGTPLPAAMLSTPQPALEVGAGHRDFSATQESKPEKEQIVAVAVLSPTAVPATTSVKTHERPRATATASTPVGAARVSPFARKNTLVASVTRESVQPEKEREFSAAEPSPMRRWLKPGLRLSLVIIAAAVVPAALAMGVYMARHQKTAVAAPLSVGGPKVISPAEQPTITAPVVAATPVDDIAKTPGASGAAQTVSARSVAPATSALPAFRPAVVAGPSTKPVLKPSSQPSAVEPPPSIMVGTQTRDSDLGKALPADSVPVPALPAVSVAGNPAPSFVAQPKEPIPGSGLLETSAPGATPPVANITNHLDPPRLVSSPPPSYPLVARSTNVSGFVLIDAVVDQMGKVGDMRVLSGNPILRQAAMESLRMWKYEPARLNGQPTSAHVQVRMNFSLH